MKRWLAGAGSLLLAWGAVGCASPRKEMLERTGSHVVYQLPPRTVMKAAEEVLAQRGYDLLPSTDPYLLQTPWKVTGNYDMGARWSRYFVEGRRLPSGRFVVRAFEMTATSFARTQVLPGLGTSSPTAPEEQPNTTPTVLLASEPTLTRSARPGLHRDLELEWVIVEHVNPAFARSVREQVDFYLAQHTP